MFGYDWRKEYKKDNPDINIERGNLCEFCSRGAMYVVKLGTTDHEVCTRHLDEIKSKCKKMKKKCYYQEL